MEIEPLLSYHRTIDDPKFGPVTVGWLYEENKTSIVYFPPERLSVNAENVTHGKSASRCPAVRGMESRFFVVKCPFDLHIGFDRDKNGKPILINRAGIKSSIRPKKIGENLVLVTEAEWRFPNRPTIQLQLPYVFVADEPVYITQLSPFAHYRKKPMPGTIFGGRFPIDVWPRRLMWAFEWHDTKVDLILKRGEPLFYVQFESNDPERQIKLVEAEKTPELQDYLDKLSGAVNYVNQTFSLFKEAARVRPETLLKPKKESKGKTKPKKNGCPVHKG